MKTKLQVLKDYPEYKRLINAVISRVGMDAVKDINEHGIDAGFSGFTYYNDTVKFFDTYKKDILKLAEDTASQIDDNGMLSMIQSFNCLSSGDRNKRKPDYTQTEIAEALFSGKGENVTTIKNAMAWFTAEEVCRMFDN